MIQLNRLINLVNLEYSLKVEYSLNQYIIIDFSATLITDVFLVNIFCFFFSFINTLIHF